jgi:hypothetical protein
MTTRTTGPTSLHRSPARARIAPAFVLLLVTVIAACSGGSTATSTASPSTPTDIDLSPSVEPFRTPTPTPKRSLGEDPEQALEELLPTGGKCESATDTVDRGAVARVKCTYSKLGQTVWMSQYEDADALEVAYAAQQAGSKTASKGCEAGRFHGVYAMGGKRHGELACLKRKKDAWIVWTIDDRNVLGEAMRKGDKSKALYQWWAKAKPVGLKTALKLTTTTPPPVESEEPSPTEE